MNSSHQGSLFLPRRASLRWLLILGIFLAALAVRLYHIDMIDFAPSRQHRALIIARALYAADQPGVAEWEKKVYAGQLRGQVTLEPTIMEHITAFAYRAAGGEHIWIPRLLSSVWWLIGGVFLFALSRELFSIDAALLSTSVYLFLPFAGLASRSFQPDPLMIMLMWAGLFLIHLYCQRPGWGRAVAAGVATALSITIKAHVVFPILGAFVAASIWRDGVVKSLWNPQRWLYGIIALSPAIAYYGAGLFWKGYLNNAARAMFLPYLLLQPSTWLGWLAQIQMTIGFTVLIGALAGFLFLSKGYPRALLAGLWIGYGIYGLVFPYHISTHDYYQLLFIPIVALSLGPTLALLMAQLGSGARGYRVRLAVFLLCVGLGMASVAVKIAVSAYDRHGRWQANEKAIASEIGEKVGHSTKTVFLSISEGLPLEYYGKIAGVRFGYRTEALEKVTEVQPVWAPEDIVNPRLLGYQPEYFIVTEILEFKRQPRLMAFLFNNYPLVAQKPDYYIFDLRKRKRA